jgi:solute carrier family 8 (sodium/calcium exchanger)
MVSPLGAHVGICEVGGKNKGLFLPLFRAENEFDVYWLRAIIYAVFLVYFFLGVAICADSFMGAIETITSRRKQLIDKASGSRSTQKVWNETVATLSLMALGSSGPEIALSVVDLFKKKFHFSDLGPATIVGSAAFNLLVIIAVCVIAIPSTEIRVIAELPAFVITAIFSVFAYVWLAFILAGTSPDRVETWEAVSTLAFLPMLIWISYKFDIGAPQQWWARIRGCCGEEEKSEEAAVKIVVLGPPVVHVKGMSVESLVEIQVGLSATQLHSPVSCKFRTEALSAVPDVDYEFVEGTLEFPVGEVVPQAISVKLLPKDVEAFTSDFLLFLEDPTGAVLDPETDGGEDATIVTISVLARNDGVSSISTSKRMSSFTRSSSFKRGSLEWREQIGGVLWIGGSREEHAEAEFQDKVMHLLSLPWKILFLAVPPTDYFGGWLTFWVALFFIGLLTAFVSDLAELFGCCVGIPDIITALTFVALGTSMPDLFASLSAAREDPTADASIVNVTGSNSVNVFLGLGLPWTIGAVYWSITGRTPDWEARYVDNPLFNTNFKGAAFMVESGNIVFMVLIFSSACVAALMVLCLRRFWLGAELGGPYLPKVATSLTLTMFWVGFVAVASWRSLTWQVSTRKEMITVLGGVGFLEFLSLAVCVLVIFLSRGKLQAGEAEVVDPEGKVQGLTTDTVQHCSSGGILPKCVRQGAGRRSLSKESEHSTMMGQGNSEKSQGNSEKSQGKSPRTLGQVLRGSASPKSPFGKTKSPRTVAPQVNAVVDVQGQWIVPQIATKILQPVGSNAGAAQRPIASSADDGESIGSGMECV